MVLNFFCISNVFAWISKKAISASLSSRGTRPVAAVSVHVSAIDWAHANSEACACCPATAFQCSATAPPYQPWSARPPLRIQGPAFPFVCICPLGVFRLVLHMRFRRYLGLGLGRLRFGIQRKRLCHKIMTSECVSRLTMAQVVLTWLRETASSKSPP